MRSIPVLFAFTDGDEWHPGIGDPTVVGWLTVVAYGIAAVVCLRAALRAWQGSPRHGRFIFWSLLATVMFCLGINKQLDLQTWLTLTGRKLAVSEGWYQYRRPIQFVFVCFVFLGGAAGFLGMWRLIHEHGRELWLPLLGLFLVVCFVIIRAASFHHVDQFLRYDIGGFRMNWLLELGGISVVIAGTLLSRELRQDLLEPRLRAERQNAV